MLLYQLVEVDHLFQRVVLFTAYYLVELSQTIVGDAVIWTAAGGEVRVVAAIVVIEEVVISGQFASEEVVTYWTDVDDCC